MRAKILGALALALLLALSLAGTALAGAYGYEIDVNAMKAQEAADTFPVRVVEKKVVEECFDCALGEYNDDALVITVSNGSTDTLAALKVCFVAYDEGNKTVEATSDMYISSFNINASPEIYTMSKEDLSVASGQNCVLSMPVSYEKFVGVRAMVAEYTKADGTVVTNPAFAVWQNLAFGLAAGGAIELDRFRREESDVKMRICICLALCALLACAMPLSALAYNSYAIDVDALKALEQQDTFEVKIVKKTVTDGANSNDFSTPDILTLHVENGFGKALAQVSVLVVCYDGENQTKALQTGGYNITISSGREKRSLYSSTFEDVNAPGGTPFQLNIACSHSNFTGARALVAQVVTADGETLTNPIYEQWQELALGSPTHMLD